MKRQTRFTTERQILDRIDDAKLSIEELFKDAVKEDQASQQCLDNIRYKTDKMDRSNSQSIKEKIQLEINSEDFKMKQHRERSVKLNKRRNSIINVTLPRLKDTLAAFKTETMAFCGDDKGVVLGG